MPRDTPDPMIAPLATFRREDTTGWADCWVGMEPTFQTRKSVRLWRKMSAEEGGEDAYFKSRSMLGVQRRVAKAIAERYEAKRRSKHRGCCMFDSVELDEDLDQWKVRRQNLSFYWKDRAIEPFEVRFSLDPETFEYSIKPVPLAWFYDDRFVEFLERFLWKTPLKEGLSPSIAHGGAQFSLSAKTFMTGSLLADDIATKLNHPELATWIMDWPNPDDRAFRATRRRFTAFRDILAQYWSGAFHPRALGVLTAENALLDRGFGPAPSPPPGLMSDAGPVGSPRDVFQTNFAFGRAVRLHAQSVHPGYWQSSHPDEDGYRPDQIMRYGEGNLNRLQIAGELHVKSGKVLDVDEVPELDAPLDFALLADECSWENRAQMSRTSARDFVEALLLDVHHAQHLQAHPRVRVQESIRQDQLLGDAEATIARHARQCRHGEAETLSRLHAEARTHNAEASRGRIKSDWIEPEALFWAAWSALPLGERAALACDAIGSFVQRVEEAAAFDPRPQFKRDPMQWHRHRIHPELWATLEAHGVDNLASGDPARAELAAWQSHRETYLSRRPVWSQTDDAPPWPERSVGTR